MENKKRQLRQLELEAYSSIVSAFRAQGGDLTDAKLRILNDLQTILNITNDRHKAELRRALNDENLNIFSEGIEKCVEWRAQSQRLIQIQQPQKVANTYYKQIADDLVKNRVINRSSSSSNNRPVKILKTIPVRVDNNSINSNRSVQKVIVLQNNKNSISLVKVSETNKPLDEANKTSNFVTLSKTVEPIVSETSNKRTLILFKPVIKDQSKRLKINDDESSTSSTTSSFSSSLSTNQNIE